MQKETLYTDVGHVTGRLWIYAPKVFNKWDLQGLNFVAEHVDRHSAFWSGVTWLTVNPLGIISFYLAVSVLGFFLLSRRQKIHWKSILGIFIVTLLLMGISEVLCNLVLKPAFGKMKPGTVNYIAGSDPPLSFPSSHAFNTAFFFALLAAALKKFSYKHWLALCLVGALVSIVVAFSRLALQVHYPTDALAGLALGATAGYLFSPVWVKAWNKLQARFCVSKKN